MLLVRLEGAVKGAAWRPGLVCCGRCLSELRTYLIFQVIKRSNGSRALCIICNLQNLHTKSNGKQRPCRMTRCWSDFWHRPSWRNYVLHRNYCNYILFFRFCLLLFIDEVCWSKIRKIASDFGHAEILAFDSELQATQQELARRKAGPCRNKIKQKTRILARRCETVVMFLMVFMMFWYQN